MALEEFEVRHDYIPDFLKSLGKLADLYEKEDDFRGTSLRRAIIALEGQIITAVEDIELFNLGDLRGVGNATLEMFKEFIETGEIHKLEKLRPATSDQVEWFASLTMDQAGYIQDWWDLEGERKWATT
jgi:DNA polymerase/3'-5' exonuclease PolX